MIDGLSFPPPFDAFCQRVFELHRRDPAGSAERYHRVLVGYLLRLSSGEPELPLVLAGLCQHLERWSLARDAYPKTTAGYRKWRAELLRFHARRARELALEVGYPAPIAERAEAILLHKANKRDAEGMAIEDAVCLTFLALELENFASTRSDEEVIVILQKTWGKMSDAGRAMALNEEAARAFPAASCRLLRAALS